MSKWQVTLPRANPGEPLVEVTPATTYLTTPLDANGDVDYVRAFNVLHSKNLTSPQDNAIIPILKVIGPDQVYPPHLHEELYQELGIEPLSTDLQYLEPFDEWLMGQPEVKSADDEAKVYQTT